MFWFGVVSFLAAIVASRVSGPNGPWLWNFDMPFFDYPMASFFHDALAAGRLPLWNNELGLGFPLYAEGQIGALYPPNWVIFQLPPLQALDAARLIHLTWLGMGTGLLALRLSGSRLGAVLAAGAIVLSGGVVTKLEWTNVIEAFAWTPWILLPLVRRPHPTRPGLVFAGIAWGIAILAGHPNVSMLIGLTAATFALATRPRLDSIPRLIGLGLIAAGVGAIQLVPSAVLWSLSVRAGGLDTADLFRLTAMPFDLLGAAFANVFVKAASPAVDLNNTWYPGGTWAPLEVGSYVGLPLLALAAVGLRVRRARPLLAAAAVLILLPIVGGQRLSIWAAIPIWNGLHAPIKGYMFLDLMLVLLAAVGLGRLRRGRGRWRLPLAVVSVLIAGYGAMVSIVLLTPDFFRELVRRFWSWPPPGHDLEIWRIAADVLGQLWPVAFEVCLGLVAIVAIAVARRHPTSAWPRVTAMVTVLVPLALLSPAFNQSWTADQFTFQNSTFTQTLAAQHPVRVLTLSAPLFWPGMPDQLATAGIADVDMFSSLNLKASDDLVTRLRYNDPNNTAARAVGVDTVVAVGSPCPGTALAEISAGSISICRIAGLGPPYWVPAAAVTVPGDAIGSLIRPVDANLDPEKAVAAAQPVLTVERTETSGQYVVNAPDYGWVFIDRSWWPAWQTTIDGIAQQPKRALSGQLLFVTPGRHVIKQTLVPWDVGLGLLLCVITLLAALAWIRGIPDRLRRRPGRRSSDGREAGVKLTREKETPGTVRFQEQDPDEDPKVGTGTLKVRRRSGASGAQPEGSENLAGRDDRRPRWHA